MCMYVCVPMWECILLCVCTCAGENGGYADDFYGGLFEAVRLNFDFLKPSGSNLHFRFFFNTSYLAQLYMNDGISKHL